MEGQKNKGGRPKEEETTTICFRIKKKKKEDLMKKFRSSLNSKFNDWTDKLLEDENDNNSTIDS